MTALTAAAARRLAIASQGLGAARPQGRIDRRHVRKVFDRVGLIQIDSVNVVARSHELVAFSRLGPYDRSLLRTMTGPDLFEYWGHEASLIPVALHPLLRFKMDASHWVTRWTARIERERPGYLEAVLDEVRQRGPISAGDLADPGAKEGPWWGWNHGKRALELLFYMGQVTATRRPSFERIYDLPERVLPPEVLALPTPTEDESRRALLMLAAASLGVATAADLCDYFRLNIPLSRPAIQSLVDDGSLEPVTVDGWGQAAYLLPGVTMPRKVRARALLSPFDSLIWNRARTERLFDVHYRLELYTPSHKRTFGYYVLPFLLDDHLVARVDLKADRQAGVLRAHAAYTEPASRIEADRVADELAAELQLMAAWLGLDEVAVGDRGDLAPRLAKSLAVLVRTP